MIKSVIFLSKSKFAIILAHDCTFISQVGKTCEVKPVTQELVLGKNRLNLVRIVKVLITILFHVNINNTII